MIASVYFFFILLIVAHDAWPVENIENIFANAQWLDSIVIAKALLNECDDTLSILREWKPTSKEIEYEKAYPLRKLHVCTCNSNYNRILDIYLQPCFVYDVTQ